jgi:isoleucyl-tRNA synthetase
LLPLGKEHDPQFDMLSNFQVKDVFLPWYNAYRFFVQNAKRLEVEGLAVFSPIDQGSLLKSSNVLDHWINSATESLVSFVRQEMDAYRLYTVECSTFFLNICSHSRSVV